MTEKYHRWYSSNLNHDMEMLVFGDRGYPADLIPYLGGYKNEGLNSEDADNENITNCHQREG